MVGSSWHQTSLQNKLGEGPAGRQRSEVARTPGPRADLGTAAQGHPPVGTFQAEVSHPAWGAETAPILGVAGPAMVTLAGLGAVGSPVSWRACCRGQGAYGAGHPPHPHQSQPPVSLKCPLSFSAVVCPGRHSSQTLTCRPMGVPSCLHLAGGLRTAGQAQGPACSQPPCAAHIGAFSFFEQDRSECPSYLIQA